MQRMRWVRLVNSLCDGAGGNGGGVGRLKRGGALREVADWARVCLASAKGGGGRLAGELSDERHDGSPPLSCGGARWGPRARTKNAQDGVFVRKREDNFLWRDYFGLWRRCARGALEAHRRGYERAGGQSKRGGWRWRAGTGDSMDYRVLKERCTAAHCRSSTRDPRRNALMTLRFTADRFHPLPSSPAPR